MRPIGGESVFSKIVKRTTLRDGYIQSGRYIPWMEQIFRREGLPVELTRLPFVESSFNLHARSKVGATEFGSSCGLPEIVPEDQRGAG